MILALHGLGTSPVWGDIQGELKPKFPGGERNGAVSIPFDDHLHELGSWRRCGQVKTLIDSGTARDAGHGTARAR